MSNEKFERLEEAEGAMDWRVEPGRYALAGFSDSPTAEDLLLIGATGQLIREGGETTLLVATSQVPRLLELHSRVVLEEDLVWFRFEGTMDWQLVGFLALVTGKLAEAGIPIGAICGFSRDHLFIAERFLEGSRKVLEGLFGPELR